MHEFIWFRLRSDISLCCLSSIETSQHILLGLLVLVRTANPNKDGAKRRLYLGFDYANITIHNFEEFGALHRCNYFQHLSSQTQLNIKPQNLRRPLRGRRRF